MCLNRCSVFKRIWALIFRNSHHFHLVLRQVLVYKFHVGYFFWNLPHIWQRIEKCSWKKGDQEDIFPFGSVSVWLKEKTFNLFFCKISFRVLFRWFFLFIFFFSQIIIFIYFGLGLLGFFFIFFITLFLACTRFFTSLF